MGSALKMARAFTLIAVTLACTAGVPASGAPNPDVDQPQRALERDVTEGKLGHQRLRDELSPARKKSLRRGYCSCFFNCDERRRFDSNRRRSFYCYFDSYFDTRRRRSFVSYFFSFSSFSFSSFFFFSGTDDSMDSMMIFLIIFGALFIVGGIVALVIKQMRARQAVMAMQNTAPSQVVTVTPVQDPNAPVVIQQPGMIPMDPSGKQMNG